MNSFISKGYTGYIVTSAKGAKPMFFTIPHSTLLGSYCPSTTLSVSNLFILMAKLYYQVKRYLVFVALLGLGFGACKKEQAAEPEKPIVETIKIAGHYYPKDSTFTVFAKYSGLAKEHLKFLQDEEVFIYKDFLKVLPSDYLTLKK